MSESLLQATVRNRDDALCLIDQHRPYVASVVRAILNGKLRSRVDVSDVVQDVQIEAVRRLDHFLDNQHLALKPWLARIARDRAIMTYRCHTAQRRDYRQEQRSSDSAPNILAVLSAGMDTPSRQLMAKQESSRVRDAVKHLTRDDQEVIRLQIIEQLSSRESAAVLGISANTVRQRLCRALVRLRVELSKNQ